MEIGTGPTTSYSHQEDWKASILGWRLERIVVVAQYMIYFKIVGDKRSVTAERVGIRYGLLSNKSGPCSLLSKNVKSFTLRPVVQKLRTFLQ